MKPLSLTFALIREGSSDDGLIPHLRNLIVRYGADEALGASRRYVGTTQERVRRVNDEPGEVDVIFVHRDADKRTSSARHTEVAAAVAAVNPSAQVIGVVPIQELESWLLIDEAQIRKIAGHPSGREPLNLPSVSRIEQAANPKERLESALLIASAKTGRRREKERRNFAEYRRRLLERLDINGHVRSLPAWQRLEADIQSAVEVAMRRL